MHESDFGATRRPWLEAEGQERTELHDGNNVLFIPEIGASSVREAQDKLEAFFTTIEDQGGEVVGFFRASINIYTGMGSGMDASRDAILVRKDTPPSEL